MKKVGNQGFREKGNEGGKHGEVKTKSRPERPQYVSPGCEPWVQIKKEKMVRLRPIPGLKGCHISARGFAWVTGLQDHLIIKFIGFQAFQVRYPIWRFHNNHCNNS